MTIVLFKTWKIAKRPHKRARELITHSKYDGRELGVSATSTRGVRLRLGM